MAAAASRPRFGYCRRESGAADERQILRKVHKLLGALRFIIDCPESMHLWRHAEQKGRDERCSDLRLFTHQEAQASEQNQCSGYRNRHICHGFRTPTLPDAIALMPTRDDLGDPVSDIEDIERCVQDSTDFFVPDGDTPRAGEHAHVRSAFQIAKSSGQLSACVAAVFIGSLMGRPTHV